MLLKNKKLKNMHLKIVSTLSCKGEYVNLQGLINGQNLCDTALNAKVPIF